jgi:hypothetical protein
MLQHETHRLPSADWRTEDLHQSWAATETGQLITADVSLHKFLQYCSLLGEVRNAYETDDDQKHFNANCFFLRGGFFAFAFLNRTSSMACRATIFGGMNHGRHPKQEFPHFLIELGRRAKASNAEKIEILMVDEVKSGTGLGTILNIISDTMNDTAYKSTCDVNITFYAIRPGQATQMNKDLRNAVRKWQGKHKTPFGTLCVHVRHFAGPLLGYDDDLLCGIKTISTGRDTMEAYELMKLSGGRVILSCDYSEYPVVQADINSNCLVEFMASCAEDLTCKPTGTFSMNLARNIESHGCFVCRQLYLRVLNLA